MLSSLAEIPQFIIDYLIQLVVGLAVLVLLPRVYAYFKIKEDDSRRKVIEDALQNGIKWAISQLIARLAADAGRTSTASARTLLRNDNHYQEVVSDAQQYVEAGTQSSLKRLGIDADTLRQRVEARIPAVVHRIDEGGGTLL